MGARVRFASGHRDASLNTPSVQSAAPISRGVGRSSSPARRVRPGGRASSPAAPELRRNPRSRNQPLKIAPARRSAKRRGGSWRLVSGARSSGANAAMTGSSQASARRLRCRSKRGKEARHGCCRDRNERHQIAIEGRVVSVVEVHPEQEEAGEQQEELRASARSWRAQYQRRTRTGNDPVRNRLPACEGNRDHAPRVRDARAGRRPILEEPFGEADAAQQFGKCGIERIARHRVVPQEMRCDQDERGDAGAEPAGPIEIDAVSPPGSSRGPQGEGGIEHREQAGTEVAVPITTGAEQRDDRKASSTRRRGVLRRGRRLRALEGVEREDQHRAEVQPGDALRVRLDVHERRGRSGSDEPPPA